MRKRLMAVLLPLVLVVSAAPTAVHAMSFPDVDGSSGYAAAVENISGLGIMVGDTQGNFNPGQIVSRCEMATIICRMLGTAENLPKLNVFTDAPAAHWANPYIGRASQLGVVSGYGDGQFGPDDPVTYEQAITMVVQAIGEGKQAIAYGGYPNGFIRAAEEHFLLEGISAVQGQGMTRGAVAMLLNNYYTWMPSKPGDGHTHHYEERTMPGSGGHYEQVQVQVQVGTKTVNDYAAVTTYGCRVCSFTTTDPTEIRKHGQTPGNGCYGGGWWSTTQNAVVGTHEEPEYEIRTKWIDGSETTIRVCALCGQIEPEAHTHRYVTKTVPGTGGHYEEVQVQVGTKTVNDYAAVTTYGCNACSFTTTDPREMDRHNGSQYETNSCTGASWWSETRNAVVGTHEEPEYETRTTWTDGSETTIRVCEICGQQE